VETKTESSFTWIRQIPGELYKLDEKPLLGFPPEFPWTAFSSGLANSLQCKDLSVKAIGTQWRAENELFFGLSDRLKTIALSVAPLDGFVWWSMPEQACVHVMHALLGKSSKDISIPADEEFFKAFYKFVAAEAINAFTRVEFDNKLALSVLKETTLPNQTCLCIDIGITLANETLYGRLFLSQEFRKSWGQRHALQQKTLALSSPIADALDVVVSLQAGKVNLKPSEWKHIVRGDFVILDSCSLEPNEDKGRVMLVINETPFFRAKIKQGSLKILEHPLYHEVDITMGTPPNNNETDAFDDADFDFDDEESSEHHDESAEHHEEQESEDFDLNFDDEEHDAEYSKPTTSGIKKTAEEKTGTKASNVPLSVDEIPLTIVVEVGRIQMSVKKLLELQPGNMLDLDIHPDSGIDMVVNGKRIARGELLKIGEALGIRITELS
jgi:flagellar motor switch protein FliN/FliY